MKRFLLVVVLVCAHALSAPFSNAIDTRCSSQPDYLLESPDVWESKNTKDLIYKVYWKLRDPESCITGIGISKATLQGRNSSQSEPLLTNFSLERLNDSVIVSSRVIISEKSLESLANKDIDRKGYDLLGGIKIDVELIRDEPKGKNIYLLQADYSLKNIWSDWFAKLKGTYSDRCSSFLAMGQNEGKWNPLTGGNFIPSGAPSLKSVSDGKYVYQLVIPNADCIDWVYTGPVSKPSYGSPIHFSEVTVWKSLYDNFALGSVGDAYLHANYPFWAGTSSEYFQGIKSDNSFVKVFTSKCSAATSYRYNCNFDKWTNLQTEQKFSRVGSDIVIDISISQNSLEQNYREEGYLSFFHGSYSRFYIKGFEYSGRGWTTSCSTIGKTTTCRSNPPTTGGTRAASTDVAFQSRLSVFENPVLVAEAKAAAELKAKQESEAKAAAEAKAKAEAEAKAKAEAEAKAAAELKAKQEAEAKAAAELKAKQEAEAKAKAEAAKKKITITCVKGNLTKKVTAVKPKCPNGYKKK